MANVNEIRSRISGVQETEKITSAMYLISSVKLTKARREQQRAMPFFSTVRKEADRIISRAPDVRSRYFPDGRAGTDIPDSAKVACLVITADRGLCGSYNMNAVRKASEIAEKHPDIRMYIIGRFGRRYFERHHIPYEKSFSYLSQPPTMAEAREISSILMEKFDDGKIDAVYAVYTPVQGASGSGAEAVRLLPYERSEFANENGTGARGGSADSMELYPSAEAVLDAALGILFTGFVYGAISDSYLSEQTARMTAMDAASKNARELTANLEKQYNRSRQDAVTNELSEISAGRQGIKRQA